MTLRSAGGSTLIELLISITLVGVILVIILGAFRIGIRAWETGERDVESSQRQQIVLSILKRQLSSIDGGQSSGFTGTGELVDFISTVSVVPGNDGGRVRVTYRVVRNDENDLYYLEIAERTVLTGGVDDTIDLLDDEKIHMLITDVYDIRFEYLKKTGPADSEWQVQWAGEGDAGLPAAVRCILQMAENKPPVTVIARILAENEAT